MTKSKSSPKIYPPETAGRRMVTNIPRASADWNLGQVKKWLTRQTQELETINYIYVVDKKRKLIGVVSIKEIFRYPENTKVSQIMRKELAWAYPYTDQERVALLALEHNLKAVPVLDKKGRFLGVVPSDVILEILNQEASEDILRLSGVHRRDKLTEITKAPIKELIRARIPWLLLGLGGSLLAASVVGFFASAIQAHLILAFFIPLVVYMAGATGTQTVNLFVRNLALDPALKMRVYFFKEIKVGIVLALISGAALSLMTFWLHRDSPWLGVILGISLAVAMSLAILVAMLVPWILVKLKKDPAFGSGPLGTVLTDILSLTVYFTVATTLLKVLG